MYRRNGKSILLLRRLLSERLRLGPASSARPPQVLRQVLPASPSYARLATDRPNTNKRKQSKKKTIIVQPIINPKNIVTTNQRIAYHTLQGPQPDDVRNQPD